jgi:hypothetical protein
LIIIICISFINTLDLFLKLGLRLYAVNRIDINKILEIIIEYNLFLIFKNKNKNNEKINRTCPVLPPFKNKLDVTNKKDNM